LKRKEKKMKITKEMTEKSMNFCKERMVKLIKSNPPDIILAGECLLFLKRYRQKYGYSFWFYDFWRNFRFIADIEESIKRMEEEGGKEKYMKGKELLKRLKEEMFTNSELNEEVSLCDILDYLAIIGIEGASEEYMNILKG
jgi:hypothetical protein